MWWTFLALLAGTYSDFVNDPAEVRFCAAAGAVQAAAPGGSPDDAYFHDLTSRKFLLRLADLGAMDKAALAAAKAAWTGSAEDEVRYEACQTLALSIPEGGTLVDAAASADGAVDGAVDGMADGDAMAAEAAAAAEAATEAAPEAEIDGAPLLAALSEPRRKEVRCATIASAIMYDVGRGVSDKSYGLTAEGAETLAGRLAEAIMTETGISEAEVRAAYKADFEAFTFNMLGEGQDEKTALATVEAGIARCRSLYDSIDLSGDGDGVVKGLAPVARIGGAAAATTAECYVMLAAFHRDMKKGSKEAESFGAIGCGRAGPFLTAYISS